MDGQETLMWSEQWQRGRVMKSRHLERTLPSQKHIRIQRRHFARRTPLCTIGVARISYDYAERLLVLIRYPSYSFTGCGAHTDYNIEPLSGAGYDFIWCYM